MLGGRASLSRRAFLRRAAWIAAGGVVKATGIAEAAPQQQVFGSSHHLAWTWEFGEDGDPDYVRESLSSNGLGIILKTHEGVNWMSEYDSSRYAISGPGQIRALATYFEVRNVPFHAWCIVEGVDPLREARMCSDVLESGARSLTLDLEPKEKLNYWQAGSDEAIAFGQELRRLQPAAWISVAPDPRPWQAATVPLREFAQFSNEIAPQVYWRTFDSPANHELFEQHGFPLDPQGLTPEALLSMSYETLSGLQRPIRPVGQGAADLQDWDRFVRHAYSLGMTGVSVWRFGTSEEGLWPLLRDLPSPARTSSASLSETHRPLTDLLNRRLGFRQIY
jgi:hypothetical protein